jgi:hypothetical protein
MELVELGDHRVPIVAQRHARLRRHLSIEDFQAIMSGDYGHESYRVLTILVPELPRVIPEWEWEGFADEESFGRWKAGEPLEETYVESADRSPTPDQIVYAFEVALKVSGAGRLGKLLDLIQTGQKMQEEQLKAQEDQVPTNDSLASSGASTE